MTLRILGGGDSIVAARRLCRAVRGVPAAPFVAWIVAVSGISTRKINGPEQGGFARDKLDNWRRRLSKTIQRLKQAGEGARGVLKGGACAC